MARTFLLTRRAVRLWITAFHYTPNVSVFSLLLMAGLELYFPSKWLACDYTLESIWGRGSFTHPQCLLILGLRYSIPNVMSSHCRFFHFTTFFPLQPSRRFLSVFFLPLLLLYPSSICSLLLIFFTVPQRLGDELITFCITGPSCHAG